MGTEHTRPPLNILPLLAAWLALVVLTLLSLGLGEWLCEVRGLAVPVAAIIWLKAWLVAHYFLEAHLSHTFIRRLVWIFIGFAPIALALTDLFGRQFAALARL